MQIKFARRFTKQYEKADQKIRTAFDKRLKLFTQNPSHPQLNNHTLTGQLSGYRSINITGDWRALYSESSDKDGTIRIIFEILGTHSQLYR